MSVAISAARPFARLGLPRGRWVIAEHIARSAIKWAVVWGVLFGLIVMSTIESVTRAYPTLSQRLQLAQSSQSFAFIAGQPHHLETVAGYTVWKVLTTAAFISAIWGLRTSIGLLRGEEEAGRWELLLAGQTTRRRATLQALLGLGWSRAAPCSWPSVRWQARSPRRAARPACSRRLSWESRTWFAWWPTRVPVSAGCAG
jgi:hypothetical protein